MSDIPSIVLPRSHRDLSDYSYNNNTDLIPHVIRTPAGGGKPILYLGAEATHGTHGEKITPVNVKLQNKLHLMHDGDIVFVGNFEGGGEMTASGNITLKGNVSGTTIDGFVPITHRIQLSAPHGTIKAVGRRQKLAKAGIEAQKAMLSDCLDCAIEAESITMRRADKHTRNFLNANKIPFACEEWIQSWPERIASRKMENAHQR